MFKLQLNGMGQLVELDMVLKHLNMTREQFTDMCIAAECDYLSIIKGTGINKAKKISENKNYLDVLQRLQHAFKNYKKLFKETKSSFFTTRLLLILSHVNQYHYLDGMELFQMQEHNICVESILFFYNRQL